MRVRRLGTEDAPLASEAIRRLKGAGDGGFGEAYLRRFLSRPENILVVAEERGAPAGFLLAYALDRVDRDRKMICIYEIGVAEPSRRRGLGRAMLEELKSLCVRQNVMKAWVVTDHANEPAMRLYAGTGGRPNPTDDVVFVYAWER